VQNASPRGGMEDEAGEEEGAAGGSFCAPGSLGIAAPCSADQQRDALECRAAGLHRRKRTRKKKKNKKRR